jgi:hypothetical protein
MSNYDPDGCLNLASKMIQLAAIDLRSPKESQEAEVRKLSARKFLETYRFEIFSDALNVDPEVMREKIISDYSG